MTPELTDLLRSVSRAFYLSLWILPGACRIPMATAYLLARSADTIADTEQLSPSHRGLALAYFRRLLHNPKDQALWTQLKALLPETDGTAESRLLARLPDSLRLLDGLSAADRVSVENIVETLTSGMEADLAHFPAGHLTALEQPADLERHTYMAAGCVGEFWTEILLRHVPSLKGWNKVEMKQVGIRFGKALQLTNVLRDLPGDLAQGRCYLPLSELRAVGLEPNDLLNPQSWGKLRPVYQDWLNRAISYFKSALDYILALPWWELKLRLSVMWPVLIGVATLDRLARANPLLPQRVKVPRSWVYQTMLLSLPAAPFNPVVRAWVESWLASIRRGF